MRQFGDYSFILKLVLEHNSQMLEILNHTGSLRSLSEIFTPSNFRRIITDNDKSVFKRRLKKHSINEGSLSFSTIIKQLYESLQASYRNEYFYKNILLNEQLLKLYELSTTTVLTEVRIGKSIADFILLNGESKLFEIKSDLDSLQKLAKQIEDYKKFASKIFVVTCERFAGKLMSDYKDSSVGIILFNSKNKLEELRSATKDNSQFDHTTIFKTLRKNEYIDIIKSSFGGIPQVPNTRIFNECLLLACQINVVEFQALVINKLKERKLKCELLLKSKKTPFELKYLCHVSDLNESEYQQLYNCLKIKL